MRFADPLLQLRRDSQHRVHLADLRAYSPRLLAEFASENLLIASASFCVAIGPDSLARGHGKYRGGARAELFSGDGVAQTLSGRFARWQPNRDVRQRETH